jgi:hypothetical protein
MSQANMQGLFNQKQMKQMSTGNKMGNDEILQRAQA